MKREKERENLLELLLNAIIPNNPKVVSLILFAVRLFGYGVLSHLGLGYLCPYIGC